MGRLPIDLLLGCSGSMAGKALVAVRPGLRNLVSELRRYSLALGTVRPSIIAFAYRAKQVVPLPEIGSCQQPHHQTGGSAAMGGVPMTLLQYVDWEVHKTTPDLKGDCKPLDFFLTYGMPTDRWENAADKAKGHRRGKIIGCPGGPGDEGALPGRITETVFRLTDILPATLGVFMLWVTASFSAKNLSVSVRPDASVSLPVLPVGKIIR